MRTVTVVCAVVGLAFLAGAEGLGGEPRKESEAGRVARLIEQLGDDEFDSREEASKALVALGEPALAALRKAAASSTDLEIRRRAKRAVDAISARMAAKELAKWQGAWKVDPDGVITIEGESWKWSYPKEKVEASGKLRIAEIGPGKTKVEWVHEAGARKGSSTWAIVHLRDANTLQYHGSYDAYPTDFEGVNARAFTRIRK